MNSDISTTQRAAKFAASLLAWFAGAVLVALMLITVVDVSGRYFFNAPLEGTLDLTQMSVVAMVYLGMAYTTYHGAHAVISVLYDRLPQPAARILDRIINLSAASLFVIIAWRTALNAIQIKQFGQSTQLLLLPLYPVYWVVVAGCVVTALIFLLQTIDPDMHEKEEQ